mmetsp:Transcript_3529/g.10949  ORF Transcript_3529/g.10949 Transcript_3529/m.10949 type:complete len:331 (+) Transcript_3529:456-1448(+)
MLEVHITQPATELVSAKAAHYHQGVGHLVGERAHDGARPLGQVEDLRSQGRAVLSLPSAARPGDDAVDHGPEGAEAPGDGGLAGAHVATYQHRTALLHVEGKVPQDNLLRRSLHGDSLEGDDGPVVPEDIRLCGVALPAPPPLGPAAGRGVRGHLQPLQARKELLHSAGGAAAAQELRPGAQERAPAGASVEEAVDVLQLRAQLLPRPLQRQARVRRRAGGGMPHAAASRAEVGHELDEGRGLRRAEEHPLGRLHEEHYIAPPLGQVPDVAHGLLQQVELEGLALQHADALRVRLQAGQVPLELALDVLQGVVDVCPLSRFEPNDDLHSH